jgi:PAS domain S-box-containing protein
MIPAEVPPSTQTASCLEREGLAGEMFASANGHNCVDVDVREREECFRLMADAAPVMIWMSGPDKRCTYFNKPWLDFTGRPIERELGDGWSEGVHPDDFQRCVATYVRAFDARQSFRMEYRLRRFDGEYRWILDSGTPRFESDGTFEGYIGSGLDITERKEAEEEAHRLRDQLAHVGRVTTMGELAAAIAHEINQPLCAIVTNAQAAQRLLNRETPDTSELSETLKDIVAGGQRASEVIGRIRTLLQKRHPEKAQLDINDAIREVVALLRHELSRKGISLSFDLASDVPAVLGDRVQLQQVVLNLVVNAMEAMTQHLGPMQLGIYSTRKGEDTVGVSVCDSGPGVAPEQVEQIFDPFFTTKAGGMGIGLAICRSIVEAHGGRIWAHRKAGRGMALHITLPSARAPES